MVDGLPRAGRLISEIKIKFKNVSWFLPSLVVQKKYLAGDLAAPRSYSCTEKFDNHENDGKVDFSEYVWSLKMVKGPRYAIF